MNVTRAFPSRKAFALEYTKQVFRSRSCAFAAAFLAARAATALLAFKNTQKTDIPDLVLVTETERNYSIAGTPESGDHGVTIDWSLQQLILENSVLNTFIFLDTCFAERASRLATHQGPGALKFLTAFVLAPFGPHSFSATLCRILEDVTADTFHISRLHERMLLRTTYVMPFYTRLPENGPIIQLQAMKARDSAKSDAEDPRRVRTMLLNVMVVPSQAGLDPKPLVNWIESYTPRNILDHAPANLRLMMFEIEKDSLATFVTQLNFNLGINENLGQRYYQRVTVLPMMWKKPVIKYLAPEEDKENDIELAQIYGELKGIPDAFRVDFRYYVKPILKLSATNSADAKYEMVNALNNLIRNHGHDTRSLRIIIYGGHGSDTRYTKLTEGDCVCAHCCHSGSAARGVSKNTIEVLAAATRNEPSGSGPRAYSKLLVKKLKQMSVRPFTAFQLHEEMLAASKAPLSQDPNNLEATPDYNFTQKSKRTPILLKPLDRDTVQTITGDRPFAYGVTNPRIFLEVELDHLQGVEDCVSEWGNWFTKRHPPPNMCGVKFYTPEEIFAKAIVEKNTLLKEWMDAEDQLMVAGWLIPHFKPGRLNQSMEQIWQGSIRSHGSAPHQNATKRDKLQTHFRP
ncbi:hypothetical protein BCR34DRAFT_587936 [Clohesyomyces aquaticus]|uniref:Uncharacterized protein n=1 Tax=Clohesyomyces aquaticus TaxID=1231657 RepID=A0A1Y1ZMF7_9PLEO|nr:hypothetical protein BCR34DRAFT_587936 [Clohesyomyces aquaticus]